DSTEQWRLERGPPARCAPGGARSNLQAVAFMTELELVRLPNGVRIALDPMPGLATTALGVWQRVGARWETAELNGVAHLFEHMAFKGAGAHDARQFAEAIENAGVSRSEERRVGKEWRDREAAGR